MLFINFHVYTWYIKTYILYQKKTRNLPSKKAKEKENKRMKKINGKREKERVILICILDKDREKT